MAWIRVVGPEMADGPLSAVYDKILGARGKLSNIMAVHSLKPRAMERHLGLYLSIMFGRSGLERAEKESIAVVVSAANGCHYCVRHHAEALLHFRHDRDWVDSLARDYRDTDLTERLRAMLDYAVHLTRSPAAMNEGHVNGLREAGLTDSDILEVNLVTSYFNFVNRIAMGLGVEFTPEELQGYDY